MIRNIDLLILSLILKNEELIHIIVENNNKLKMCLLYMITKKYFTKKFLNLKALLNMIK